jgi:hypothetical protein
MPQIVLGGSSVTKAALVEGAYDYCGLNGFEYERTPEEMTTGLRRLNGLMSALAKKGIDLSFEFPSYSEGLLEEPSGIPDDAVDPVVVLLAQRIAPALGASLSADARSVLGSAMQDLYANYASAPPTVVPAYILPSIGVRHGRFVSIDTLSDDDGDGDADD